MPHCKDDCAVRRVVLHFPGHVSVQKEAKGEATMLRFFCPTDHNSFDAGVFMDAETYKRERMDIIRVTCPHCGREHRFLVADAEFMEAA